MQGRPRQGARAPFISLGTKTAVLLSVVLALSGLAIAFDQSSQTRMRLVESKLAASVMIVDLFAASVAPALDFGDDEGLHQEVQKLAGNPDIVYAAVFSTRSSVPAAEIARGQAARPARPDRTRHEVRSDRIEVARVLSNQQGDALGSLVVSLSLMPENERFVAARQRIMGFAGMVTLLAAALVVAISRRVVTAPLQRLSHAASVLEGGSAEPVAIGANDEIGQLGGAFNRMASAIVDRERRLAELNRELMQLLDSMRQAILVFGEGGVLAAVKSHEAEEIFGTPHVEGLRVQDLLFPGGAQGVAAQAFAEWLAFAFRMPVAAWSEVLELGPSETVLEGPHGDRYLSLDFRPIESDGKVARIMLLASDETEKRTLERAVKERVEEHEKQMAAMRRLVAGGGQLLVSVLDRARGRLEACSALLAARTDTIDQGLVEQLFQHAHSVKGEARAFDLSLLDTAAAELEDYLAILRGRLRRGTASHVTEVAPELERLVTKTRAAVARAGEMLVEASPIGAAILEQVTVQRAYVERLLSIAGSRSDEIGRLVTRIASRPFGELLLGLSESVPRWAAREGKRAHVEVEGRQIPVPPSLAAVLPDALTHLLRNAVAHGIEPVEERAAKGKAEVGIIRVEARETRHGPEFVVEDDGVGIDRASVSRRATELGIERSAEEDALRLVFEEGLTTAQQPTELAGHGVGLGAVRRDLEKVGYRVSLQSGTTGLKIVLSPNVERLEAERQLSRVAEGGPA